MSPEPVAVTAVIPCFNAAPWLRQCLESILRQTHPVSEIVVVDDASTDASAAIAGEYPVRLLRLPANLGPAGARNAGLRAATHDVVAWLDADDAWDPHHCATVVPLLADHPTAAAAFAQVRLLGHPTGHRWGHADPCPGPTSLVAECLTRCVVPIMAAITRREMCLEIGGFREASPPVEDFDFWIRLALKHPFVWTNEVTGSYRWRHAPTQASANLVRQWRSIWEARLWIWNDLRASADGAHLALVEEQLPRLWRRELAKAWLRRELDSLRAVFTLPGTAHLDTPLTRQLRSFLGIDVTEAGQTDDKARLHPE